VSSNSKRLYSLGEYTVECTPKGWYYARTARFGDKEEMKGPYGSIKSVTLMIARELGREITRRHAPHVEEA
jgi:hypothetical protein